MTEIYQSIAGHDQGLLYLSVGVKDGKILVTDGKHHKQDSPKRKNPKHLHQVMCAPKRVTGTDAEIRRILASVRNSLNGTALEEEGS